MTDNHLLLYRLAELIVNTSKTDPRSPVQGGHIVPVNGDQFTPVLGGQFAWIFQAFQQTSKMIPKLGY
jgi:hypothetical protein